MIRPAIFVPVLAAALACGGAAAQGGGAAGFEDTDWLIARNNGEWQLVAKGPVGRVYKEFPNQEVLRLQGGSSILVVSMPPIRADESTYCSARARRDARNPCASGFLACRPDPGGIATTVAKFALGGGEAAADERNRLACRVDVDAILAAAKDVGMIRDNLPVQDLDR